MSETPDLIARLRSLAKFLGWAPMHATLTEAAAELERLTTALATAEREAFEAGYAEGFGASGEGYNAEYPFSDRDQDYTADANWIAMRESCFEAFTQRATQAETETP